MELVIDYQCPQCGAPAQLDESDRLFTCGFCRVKSYLVPADVFRYHLPHKIPKGREIFWAPYWRFKGMRFASTPTEVAHRFIDVSGLAVTAPELPATLGLRGQAMRLAFVTPEIPGRFLHPVLPLRSALSASEQAVQSNRQTFHRVHIGETVSLVYAPFYTDKTLMDGILNRPVGSGPPRFDPQAAKGGAARQSLQFMATLCPACGWDMEGNKQSAALVCRNCRSVWQPRAQRFERVSCAFLPSDDPEAVFFPFWRIQPLISPIVLASHADLIRVANLPRVARDGWDKIPFYFWIPGFKVRSQTYLNLCRSMTLSQPMDAPEPDLPAPKSFAITLPLSEAVESLKICLASFIKPPHKMLPLLPDIKIDVAQSLLVFVPFREDHHEFVQDRLRVAVHKNQMALAYNL